MIGIYKITNPKGFIYIGQSINIEKRIENYKKRFCKKQPKLHYSFLKYGFDAHNIEIVCECEKEELNQKERFYQQLFNTVSKKGLNCKLTNENDFNGSFCEETKQKMSESAKKKVFSDSHRKTMSINRSGKGNAMYGKKHSEETRKKISESRKNMSEESRLKYSIIAKNRSEEHLRKLSESHLGKKPGNMVLVLNTQNGIFYESIKEAEATFTIKKGYLSQKLKGYRKNDTPFIKA